MDRHSEAKKRRTLRRKVKRTPTRVEPCGCVEYTMTEKTDPGRRGFHKGEPVPWTAKARRLCQQHWDESLQV